MQAAANYIANRCYAEALNVLALELDALEENHRKTLEELARAIQEFKDLEQEIREFEKQMEVQKRRLEDFEVLKGNYVEYESNRSELEHCKKQEIKLSERQELFKKTLLKLENLSRTLEIEADMLVRAREEFQKKIQIFGKYERSDEFGREVVEHFMAEREMMEVRYTAIIGTMSQEIQELEEQEIRAMGRYEAAVDELEHLRIKFSLKENAWKNIHYDRKEEAHQETMLDECRKKVENKRILWGEEDKCIAVADQQMKDRIRQMKNSCGKEQPLPKNEIQNEDFEARKNQLRYQEKETQKETEQLKNRLYSYDENLTALSEYSEFEKKKAVQWEQVFAEMSGEELR